MKYHRNILKDTIEIIKIRNQKIEKVYMFVAESENSKN